MVSTPFNSLEFTKERIDISSQYLITKFKMCNGLPAALNSSWFQVNSLLLPHYTTLMVSLSLSLGKDSETRSESVLSEILWLWAVLEISIMERWISGAWIPWRKSIRMERQRLLALQRFYTVLVVDIFLLVFYMRDWKSTMAFSCSELMEPRCSQRVRSSLSYTMFSGNLMKQGYCLNQISINFLRRSRRVRAINPRNYLDLEEEE